MRRTLLILVSLAFVIAFAFDLYNQGFSWATFGGLLFFGICLLVSIFEERLANWTKAKALERSKASHCIFESDRIVFPKGYEFRKGYLKNKKHLYYKEIDEFRLNTNPMSVLINGNELIFLVGAHHDDCVKIAEREGIPIVDKTDIWSLICDEFLDTEFDDDYLEATNAQLAAKGFSTEEVEEIRGRIRTRMLAQTYMSWEWQYYGQYNVLRQLQPVTEERYWWTMGVALREGE